MVFYYSVCYSQRFINHVEVKQVLVFIFKLLFNGEHQENFCSSN